MDYYALFQEIDAGPLKGDYAAMDDGAVAKSLNTANCTRNRVSISGDQAFQATNGTEYAALTAEKRQLWMAFCGRSNIDPFAASNVAFVTWVFGGASATVTALSALRVEAISRAVELGLGTVRASDVEKARLEFGGK